MSANARILNALQGVPALEQGADRNQYLLVLTFLPNNPSDAKRLQKLLETVLTDKRMLRWSKYEEKYYLFALWLGSRAGPGGAVAFFQKHYNAIREILDTEKVFPNRGAVIKCLTSGCATTLVAEHCCDKYCNFASTICFSCPTCKKRI